MRVSRMRERRRRLGRLREQLLDCPRQVLQLDGLVEMNAVVEGDVAQGVGRNIARENDERDVPTYPPRRASGRFEPRSCRLLPLTGGSPTTLFTYQPGPVQPTAITVFAGEVFWVDSDKVQSVSLDGAVGGGYNAGAQAITSAEAGACTVDVAGNFVLVPKNLQCSGVSNTGAAGIATWGSRVYWTDALSNSILSVDLACGLTTTLVSSAVNGATSISGPQGIATNGTALYWTEPTQGLVMALGLDGGSPGKIAVGQHPWAIAADGTSVYWTDRGGERDEAGEVINPPALWRVEGAMSLRTFLPFLVFVTGCGTTATTFVHANDTTLGRVVVYRNGVAYFERTAEVQGDHLTLKVPGDKIDDFLKSLSVVDAKTGQPQPISYPTKPPPPRPACST